MHRRGSAVVCSLLGALSPTAGFGAAGAAVEAPLVLEASIPLGAVRGRIDHLGFDSRRERLYVAELGNDTVAAVDLRSGRVIQTLAGFSRPQGIGYATASDEIVVANGGDGTVRRLNAATLAPSGLIRLGEDADNVRIDASGRTVFVGHGDGALALLQATGGSLLRDVALPAHPEGFQISADGRLAYVNLPDARAIALVDLETGSIRSRWPTGGLLSNFPMALEPGDRRLWVVFRDPARLVSVDTTTGVFGSSMATCGDSDDLFIDDRDKRLYVICGSGEIEVIDVGARDPRSIARVGTRRGARTGLLVPALNRLYVAGRATSTQPAMLWVFRLPEEIDRR